MYLSLHLLFVFAIILLYLNRKRIHLKPFYVTLFVLFLIAVLWDYLSVRMWLWTFSEDEIVENILVLPIEEYLFFIFVLFNEGILRDCGKNEGWLVRKNAMIFS